VDDGGRGGGGGDFSASHVPVLGFMYFIFTPRFWIGGLSTPLP